MYCHVHISPPISRRVADLPKIFSSQEGGPHGVFVLLIISG